MIEIPAGIRAEIERWANSEPERSRRAYSSAEYECCPICFGSRYVSSWQLRAGVAPEIRISVGSLCAMCGEVQRRNPEVFARVLGILAVHVQGYHTEEEDDGSASGDG